MHAPTGTTTPKDKPRELQRKLYLAAKRSRNRRFHALYDRRYRPDILWRALSQVDGVEDLERAREKGVGEPFSGLIRLIMLRAVRQESKGAP